MEAQQYYDDLYMGGECPFHRHPGSYEHFVCLLGDPPPEARCLDIGCGNGLALRCAAEAGLDTYGLDLSTAALEHSREASPESSLLAADAVALPFAEGAFDCVISLGVLEHTGDVPRALSEVGRVLRPGGKAVLVLPNSRFALGLYPGTGQREAVREQRHTLGEWVRLLRESGLELVSVGKDLQRFWPPGKQRFLPRLTARLARGLLAAWPLRYTYQFVFVVTHP